MELSDHRSLVACRDCSLLQPLVYIRPTQADDSADAWRQAYRDFLAEHSGHDIACFARHGDALASDHALWDPMATIRFEVTDGERIYVATGSRPSLEEPRVYRFGPGTLDMVGTVILVDDEDLRRGLDWEFYPHALQIGKLDRFLLVMHEIVGRLNPEELSIAFDDADDPMVSIARMPDRSYQELLARCAEIFDSTELDTVSKFLRDNRDEDGLLALRVRRELRASG
jgi:hypothetical protein